MTLDNTISKLFLPDDESWLRHANPWSIWTRFATLPFVVLSIWSRVWLEWYCLVPILLLVLWIWLNPKLFSKPKSYDNWGSKAVLGERILMKRKDTPIPAKHHRIIVILNTLQVIGSLILIYGLYSLNIYITIHGVTFVYLAKMWFLDRMVWLYEDSINLGKLT
jgi:hypothetical protein